ncbi:MAG: PEP-CTERM sorting domain-containing protein [Cytophagales bacterium]|nr:PEP-CTERM sorting domain-containing protein [Armatimonadota bacterium]
MYIRSVRSVFSAALVVLLLLASRSTALGQIVPKLETTIGTGSSVSYFVLDFLGGLAPQSYAFAYRYDGAKTGGDLISALATDAPGFSVQFQQFSFGRYYEAFGYDGKSLAAPLSDRNNYWSYWIGPDGQDWASPTFGADSRPLANGSWDGWSYAANNIAVAPTTPRLDAGSAAPEPGTLALLAVGAISGLGTTLRRRRRAERN